MTKYVKNSSKEGDRQVRQSVVLVELCANGERLFRWCLGNVSQILYYYTVKRMCLIDKLFDLFVSSLIAEPWI